MFNLFTFLIQSIFIIGFTIIIIFLLRHNAFSKFEERIGKYDETTIVNAYAHCIINLPEEKKL